MTATDHARYIFSLAWTIWEDEQRDADGRATNWTRGDMVSSCVSSLCTAMEQIGEPADNVRPVEDVTIWGEFIGASGRDVAIKFGLRVLNTLEDGRTGGIRVGSRDELLSRISAESVAFEAREDSFVRADIPKNNPVAFLPRIDDRDLFYAIEQEQRKPKAERRTIKDVARENYPDAWEKMLKRIQRAKQKAQKT